MKLSNFFPNYILGLMDLIHDKPIMDKSDDKMKIMHQLPLASSNKAFDFYELNQLNNGSVYFEIVTMNGFRSIVKTRTVLISDDLTRHEWFDLISKTAINHFYKEEYQALKKGYIKQGKSGCSVLLSIALLAIVNLVIYKCL